MLNNKLKYFLILLFLLPFVCVSQVRYTEDGQIENTEIVVEKNKKITFPERSKVLDKSLIPKKTTPISEPQNYQFKEHTSKLPEIEPKIKISSVKEESSISVLSNFARAGGGNFGTSYFESAISNKNPSNLTFGLHGKHFASMFGPTEAKNNSGNSSNFIQGFANLYTKKTMLTLSADYERKGVYFYGYGKNTPISKDAIYQAFNEVSIKSKITSIDSLTKVPFDIKAEYFYLNDRFKAKETEVYVNGNAFYNINDFSKILLNGNISIASRSDSTNQARNLIQIKPLYEYLLNEKITLRAGINFAFNSDTVKSSSIKNIHIHPILQADYQIHDKHKASIGLEGGVERNTLRTLINENPWLNSNIPLAHTNKVWDLNTSVKGNLSSYFYYKLNASYSRFRYMSFFNNSVADSSKFSVLYDDKGTNLLKIGTEVVFQKSQSFKLGLKANYYNYDTKSISLAWHRPEFEISSWLSYNLYSKLYFYLDIFYISGLKSYNFSSNREYQLPDILDVSLKIDYKLNERLSIFLYGFNLIGQNYMRYNSYQVKGVNVLGGLTFAF